MAVQVGRTVISFTIKYIQSEKEKLKSDITKVLDSKNKNKLALKDVEVNFNYNQEMQATQVPQNFNLPPQNEDDDDDDEPPQMDMK